MMFSKETQYAVTDVVNDTVDVILDDLGRAFLAVLFPVLCFALAFFAGSQGFFEPIFPDAGWGASMLMGGFLYSVLMVAWLYITNNLGFPERDERSAL